MLLRHVSRRQLPAALWVAVVAVMGAAAAAVATTAAPVAATTMNATAASAGLAGSAGTALRPLVHPADVVTTHRIVVGRVAPADTFAAHAHADGEALLTLTARAPGADWAVVGHESAVLAVLVDGRLATHLVVPSAVPTKRVIGLGPITRGWHRISVSFVDEATPAGVDLAVLSDLRLAVRDRADAGYDVAAHAPIVVGRTLPELGSPYQNATTDSPLLAWHETTAAATAGHVVVEYSVVWSNEDGGTDTPALMARWGRTTDIEWIYRVELDERGERVPGSDVYQAPNHATLGFTGSYLGAHALLQTCTANNNMCDAVTPNSPLRFLLGTDDTRPADRAREVLMDTHPWTYPVMAAEQLREGRIEPTPDPATPAVGDQRTYLWIEVDKDTGAAAGTGAAPGLTVGVRLVGDPVLYLSDHGHPDWSIARDIPAASTVELPVGTTSADIAEIVAIRRPMGAGDNGAPVTVTSINRAFFLGADYRPMRSFVNARLAVTLTPAQPTAILVTPGAPQ